MLEAELTAADLEELGVEAAAQASILASLKQSTVLTIAAWLASLELPTELEASFKAEGFVTIDELVEAGGAPPRVLVRTR